MTIASDRARKILSAIIQDYIRTAEPVGSKAIATKYSMGLSPATIRNIMAELEDQGYLVQPHTSAGRVPTEKGFRLYVDGLLSLEEPGQGDKDIIKKSFNDPVSVEMILTDTAKALSAITGCAGLMFVPSKESFTIKHINLLPMDRASVMVLFISSLGLVRTKLIRMDEELKSLDIERISNYLNSIAGGLTIRELKARIIREMQVEKNLYDELLAKALSLGAKVLQQEGGAEECEVFVEGKVNIIDQPEFRDDFERMRNLFAAFEEKSLLVKILDKSIEDGGVHIYLGSEFMVKDFEGLSFVTAPYSREGELLGTLGVIGPVRMNYSRIIPLVDYTAALFSKVF